MGSLILAGVLVTFLTAVLGFITSVNNRKKIQEVHFLVNSQLNSVLNRVQQLTKALEDSGTEVPAAPHDSVSAPKPSGD
jgi:hypothetical protein